MLKCSWKNRILQRRLSTFVSVILCLIAIIQFFTFHGEYDYKHIPIEDINKELYKEVNHQIVIKKTKIDCNYEHILNDTKTIDSWKVPKQFEDFSASGIVNGSFVPENCNPLFSVAIIVTYRNRQKQLDIFLPYIHNFLRKQSIHYKIYLIEQQDEKPWNKGMLYNIGAKRAIADKFPCLILHDVDLLPLDSANLYVCARSPRHASASIDKFRFLLPYHSLVGGVLAIRSDHYTMLNGFSNRFQDWGGEDDDFAERITKHKLNIVRYPRTMSRYTMLLHHQEAKNAERLHILAENKHQSPTDGFNSVRYQSIEVHSKLLIRTSFIRVFTVGGLKKCDPIPTLAAKHIAAVLVPLLTQAAFASPEVGTNT